MFKELSRLAGNEFGVAFEQIVKDYWITRMLKQLEQSEFKDNVYFKGGTCLLKAYNIIRRFSEDLDLYVDTNNPKAGGDPERRMNGAVYHFLIDQNKDIHNSTAEEPDIERGLYNRANFLVNGSTFGTGLKRYLQVETTISSIKRKTQVYQPHEQREIISMIGKFLKEKKEYNIIHEYGLGGFTINCIRPEKTLCDKVSRLIRLSFEDEPYKAIASAARDLYDIYYLVNDIRTAEAIKDKDFEKGLLLTFEQDRLQHKYPHTDKNYMDAVIFKETDSVLASNDFITAYKGLTKLLIDRENNKLPELIEIGRSIKMIIPIISNIKQEIDFLQRHP